MHKLFIFTGPLLPMLEGQSNVSSSPLVYPKFGPVRLCARGAKGNTPWEKVVGRTTPAVDRAATAIEAEVPGTARITVIATEFVGAVTRTYFTVVGDEPALVQVDLSTLNSVVTEVKG